MGAGWSDGCGMEWWVRDGVVGAGWSGGCGMEWWVWGWLDDCVNGVMGSGNALSIVHRGWGVEVLRLPK